jgi:molybdate transport system regulatory protein
MSRITIELKPRVIVAEERAIGPGKADLLEWIERTGSISAAAKKMKMSYRRAWTLVDTMNRAFKTPLVDAATGGAGGGGAAVTAAGREVLALYRNLQRALEQEASSHLADFRKRLK